MSEIKSYAKINVHSGSEANPALLFNGFRQSLPRR